MGLSSDHLSLVPQSMDIKDCYERIYTWHKKNGRKKIIEKENLESSYSKKYLALLDKLPLPKSITREDMDYIFSQVIWGDLEWAYHEKDSFGIKLAAYAHYAINKVYGGLGSDDFSKSLKSSSLFNTFRSRS